MPNEYFEWLNSLKIRDTYALYMFVAALLFYLAYMALKRWLPGTWLTPQRWVLPVIILSGTGLRLLAIGEQSLWYDEAYSALVTQRSLTDVLAAAAHDYHPPAYYLLLWVWSRLWPYAGLPGDGWLRLPSAFLGAINVGLTYVVARQWGRPWRESITATALMAFLPFQIAYSQEARMYQMLLTGALLTLSGYVTRRWWLVVLAGTMLLYTHAMSAFFLAALGVVALGCDRSRLKALFVSGVIILGLYLAWLWYGLIGQLTRMGGGHYWIPQITPGAFVYLWHVLLWHEASPTPIAVPGLAASMLLLVAATAAGLVERNFRLLGLMFLPPLLAIPASLLLSPVILPRTFITVTPAYYILIAAALGQPGGVMRRLLTTALVMMIGVGLWGYYTDAQLHKWPNRVWAAELTNRYRPGDAVLYLPQSLPFLWYLPANIPQLFLPPDETARNAGFNLTREAATALGLVNATPANLANYTRVFVVFGRSPATSPSETNTFEAIKANYPLLWQKIFVKDGNYLEAGVFLFQWGK